MAVFMVIYLTGLRHMKVSVTPWWSISLVCEGVCDCRHGDLSHWSVKVSVTVVMVIYLTGL